MNNTACLSDTVFHLTDGLGIRARAGGARFWADPDRPEFRTGRLVSVFSYEHPWDYRERHPDGEELVCVLSGEIDLLLDEGDGERAVRMPAGSAGIVPAGAWHRVSVRAACTLLFVTPVPARTEHRAGVAG